MIWHSSSIHYRRSKQSVGLVIGIPVALAIFDLDNTLIAGDSDHAWGQYLIDLGIVDKFDFKQKNDQFYQDYLRGQLDIMTYLQFALAPLKTQPMVQLLAWREAFMEEQIKPLILPAGREKIASHRAQGDHIMIITATNDFVTAPIASALEVDTLLATEAECVAGKYTGRVAGTPCYQEGKVHRLQQWLAQNQAHSLEGAYFYSDSHNDLPLMSLVEHPVAVDADDTLLAHAQKHGWPAVSFRE